MTDPDEASPPDTTYLRALAAFDEGDRKARLEEVSALTLYVRSLAILALERWRMGR
jgi:hypothetical protein